MTTRTDATPLLDPGDGRAATDPMEPGSPDAVARGCACPPWINADGRGVRLAVGCVAAGVYLVHPACRVHTL